MQDTIIFACGAALGAAIMAAYGFAVDLHNARRKLEAQRAPRRITAKPTTVEIAHVGGGRYQRVDVQGRRFGDSMGKSDAIILARMLNVPLTSPQPGTYRRHD